MPNWCYTSISIFHNDKNKLKEFYEKLRTWLKKTYAPNGFDKYSEGWLGNIVGNSGLAKWVSKGDYSDFEPNISCRGSVTSFELMEGQININTETVWSPCLKMFTLLCDKYLPDANIIYTADECGCELYATNDPDMIGKYYVDLLDDTPEGFEDLTSEYEASEDYVVKLLRRILKTSETDIGKLLQKFEQSGNDWLGIHKWDEVPISVFE